MVVACSLAVRGIAMILDLTSWDVFVFFLDTGNSFQALAHSSERVTRTAPEYLQKVVLCLYECALELLRRVTYRFPFYCRGTVRESPVLY